MSTTQIELDQELVERAASILGTRTKMATVNEALRRVVQAEDRRRHLEELAARSPSCNYDRDCERIAEITGQATEWIVPAGTADQPG